MKKVVQNLKCGGPSKKTKKGMKKFANGSIDTSNLKMPTLAPAIDKLTLASGPENSNTGSMDKISKGADFISDTFGGVMDERKNALLSNIDNREDPSATMKKSSGLDTAKSLVSGTAKGAAIAGIPGAIAGFAISGLARLLGTKNRLAEESKATEKWSNSWSAKTAASMKESGYKDGGDTSKKRTVYFPIADRKYDKDLNIDNGWINRLKKAKNIDELDNSVIGQWESKPLTMKQFLDFPEHVKNYYKPHHSYEFQKNKLGLPNNYQELNMKLSPGGTGGEPMYTPSRTAREAGNNVAYVGEDKKYLIDHPIAGLKKGGSIKGKGTGKSDSIPMKAPEGSFIVPTENADHAEELGKSFLGWSKEEKAKRNNGGTDIKVSDGEVFFTPDEVHVLKYHGVNLDELAPKAENKIEMKKGGKIDKKKIELIGFKKGTKQSTQVIDWTHDKTNDLVINDKTKTAYDRSGSEYVFNIDQNKYVKMRSGSPYGIDIYNQAIKQGDTETPLWLQNLPELSGALQAAGGAFGLMQAGKTPDMAVSRTLTKLSGEVRKLAEFGYEPAVLNALNNEIETTRMNISTSINNEGGSGIEKMAKLNTLLSTTIDKKAGLAFANAAEKSRKWADVLKVDTMKAGQEFDINKIKLEDWYKNQEVFAGLVTAGISNIVGARQLKSEQDTLKEIGGKNPTWTPRKP